MTIQIRAMKAEDVETCGRICYDAFKDINDKHNFRPELPAPEVAIALLQAFFENPDVFDVVAESDGQVIGSNHMWEYDAIRAVGPITVVPNAQAKGVGRMLMEAVIERARDSAGIRLIQDAFNVGSLSLYASLGFDIKEPLVLIEGVIKGEVPNGFEVRRLTEEDYEGCAELCRSVYGFDRTNELRYTPPPQNPFVALRDGRITAYMSGPQFWNHSVAESESDMRALLIGAGNQLEQPFLIILPVRHTDLFRWCLKQKMKVIKAMTLMAMGEYQEPRGCYLPSVGY